MRSILVAEDEKMIRQGICEMIENAPIHVDTVLSCKNGEEAWSVLQNQPVDVMITDIRMPKMTGLELLEKTKSLRRPPITIVLSGYDDPSYIRHSLNEGGISNYLLKPIRREELFQLLQDLDAKIEAKAKQDRIIYEIRCIICRSIILDGKNTPSDLVFSKQDDQFLFQPYFVVCAPIHFQIEISDPEIYVLNDINGHNIFIFSADMFIELQRSVFRYNCCVGMSREADTPSQLKTAYQEALNARKFAFIKGNLERYNNVPASYPDFSIEDILPPFYHLQDISQVDSACKKLKDTLFFAQNGEMSFSNYIESMASLPERIIKKYEILLEEKEKIDLTCHNNPLMWETAYEYTGSFQRCIRAIFPKQLKESVKDKILRSVIYIKANFHLDIDMGTVSREVFMNYNQFSTQFKKIIKVPFSQMLQSLRLEEAKRLLEETDLKIAKIAKQSGFNSEKHFMNLFKEIYSVTPSTYRKSIQK